ncbi:hypothetical protein [Paraburkholderia sp. 40]
MKRRSSACATRSELFALSISGEQISCLIRVVYLAFYLRDAHA